jgi:hypothetical protein
VRSGNGVIVLVDYEMRASGGVRIAGVETQPGRMGYAGGGES